MFPANIAGNGIIEGIAGCFDGGRNRHPIKAQHRNIRSAATDIHNHMSLGAANIQIRTHGRCQRLLDQIHATGTCFNGRIDHRTLLHLGDTAGHADDHTGFGGKQALGRSAAQQHLQHTHRHHMVGDDAILQRMHRHHITRGTAQHISGFRAHLQDAARIPVHRHHRGFPHGNTLSIHIDQHIGCAKIHA